jgi:hypothetical protein
MFVYWFRYSCLLILGQRSNDEYALKVASRIRLSFPEVLESLRADPRASALQRLHRSLDHDYRVLTELLQNASGPESIERRILAIDYKLLKLCCQFMIARGDNTRARKALIEMSSILQYFAAEIGASAAA